MKVEVHLDVVFALLCCDRRRVADRQTASHLCHTLVNRSVQRLLSDCSVPKPSSLHHRATDSWCEEFL